MGVRVIRNLLSVLILRLDPIWKLKVNYFRVFVESMRSWITSVLLTIWTMQTCYISSMGIYKNVRGNCHIEYLLCGSSYDGRWGSVCAVVLDANRGWCASTADQIFVICSHFKARSYLKIKGTITLKSVCYCTVRQNFFILMDYKLYER